MRVYRVRLPDGAYYQHLIEGEPVWTTNKQDAAWWRREGGAKNAAQWLIDLGHLDCLDVPTRHRRNPGAYVDWQDEDEPASSPGDD